MGLLANIEEYQKQMVQEMLEHRRAMNALELREQEAKTRKAEVELEVQELLKKCVQEQGKVMNLPKISS